MKSRVAKQIKDKTRELTTRFPTVESHYCRKESQRMYLRQSVESSNNVQFWLYEHIFNPALGRNEIASSLFSYNKAIGPVELLLRQLYGAAKKFALFRTCVFTA